MRYNIHECYNDINDNFLLLVVELYLLKHSEVYIFVLRFFTMTSYHLFVNMKATPKI